MLVLSRYPGQGIVIDGGRIELVIVEVDFRTGAVKVGIEADRSISADRKEVHLRKMQEREATNAGDERWAAA